MNPHAVGGGGHADHGHPEHGHPAQGPAAQGSPTSCCAGGHPAAPNDPVAHGHPTARGTIYTCPMHPQIRQPGPGTCPICGMALEPLLPAQSEDDSDLRTVRRKFWISLGLSAPVVLFAMLSHVLPTDLGMGGAWLPRYAEVLLTAPVVLWAAADYYRRGWLGVVNRSPNMYTLIGLGVLVAYLYSLLATFAPGMFSPGGARCTWHGRRVFRSLGSHRDTGAVR